MKKLTHEAEKLLNEITDAALLEPENAIMQEVVSNVGTIQRVNGSYISDLIHFRFPQKLNAIGIAQIEFSDFSKRWRTLLIDEELYQSE